MHDEIREAAQRCRRWLVEEALPHWGASGFDWERGLFAEGLDEILVVEEKRLNFEPETPESDTTRAQ